MGCSCCKWICKKKPENSSSQSEPPVLQVFQAEAVIIETKFSKDDILKSDQTPQNTQKGFMLFSCPICMSFYSHMLITKCCKNYICFFCSQDLKSANHDISCPHCRCKPVHLVDVDPNLTVKKYSDSPQHTQIRGDIQWVPVLQVVEEQNIQAASFVFERSEQNGEGTNRFYSSIQ